MSRQGLPVREIAADTDKYSRALPAAARIESGSAYFLKGAHWLPEYEEELIAFPIGSHDDQVDVTSYAVKSLLESVTSKAVRPFLVGGY